VEIQSAALKEMDLAEPATTARAERFHRWSEKDGHQRGNRGLSNSQLNSP
jgi:hypothetical protein